jgi:Zn finger protein HypA/HybF involved in hydrogenase expression
MGEYDKDGHNASPIVNVALLECWDCDEKFHLEEPPYDGRAICDECRKEDKQNEKGIYNINH